MEHRVAVSLEEIVQCLAAELKVISLVEAGAGEENLAFRLPVRLRRHMGGHGVKNIQELGAVEFHAPEGDFRHDHFPIGGGYADDLYLVPDAK